LLILLSNDMFIFLKIEGISQSKQSILANIAGNMKLVTEVS